MSSMSPIDQQSVMYANRCNINKCDCELAIKYLDAREELLEKDKELGTGEFFDHQEGLLVAAIISYARAFKRSRGRGDSAPFVEVECRKVFKGDERKIALHNLIIDKRDKAVAHSDAEYYKAELVEVQESGAVLRKQPCVIYGDGIDAALFKEIAEDMREYFLWEQHKSDVGL